MNTLSDVFNAGARAASPFLQQGAAELKERNDLELKNFAAGFANDVQNWQRDNPYNGDFEGYLAKLNGFTEKAHGEAMGSQTSAYSRKMLSQMQTQALEMARGHAEAEEDKWRWQKEDVEYKRDIQGYMDAGWNPKMTMDAVYNRLELSKTKRHIDPQQEAAMKQAAETACYQQYAAKAVSNAGIQDLTAVMEQVRKDFEGVIPRDALKIYDAGGDEVKEYDADGNEIERKAGIFDGQKEWERKLVQGRAGEIFKGQEGAFQRLILSGNLAEARRFGKEWEGILNGHYKPGNKEFENLSDEQRLQFDRYFNWRELDGYAGRGAGGAAEAAFNLDPALLVRAVLEGGDELAIPGFDDPVPTATMREAFESFATIQAAEFRTANRHMPSVWVERELQSKQEGWLRDFNRAMEHQLSTEHRELGDEYARLSRYTAAEFDRRGGDYYINSRIRGEDRARLINDTIKLARDLKWAGVSDPLELRRRVQSFIAGDVSRNMTWNGTPDNEGDRTIKLAKYTEEVLEQGKADDLVFSETKVLADRLESDEGEDNLIWRSQSFKDSAEAVRTEEWGDAAQMLGLEMTKLDLGWMTAGKDRDPIPKGTFTVRGEGELDGEYVMKYDGNSNRELWKKNAETGEYEKTDITERRENTAPEQRRLDRYIREELARRSSRPGGGSHGNPAWEQPWEHAARQRENERTRDRIIESTRDWTFEDWEEYRRQQGRAPRGSGFNVDVFNEQRAGRGNE